MKFKTLLIGLLVLGFASVVAANDFVYNFTNCGAEGRLGPSQSNCDNAYSGTSLEGDVNIVGDGIQEWTPPSGLYRIQVYGAEGGIDSGETHDAGKGAMMEAEILIDNDQPLYLLVGQKGVDGDDRAGGGGGGSFVAQGDSYDTSQPIIVAGGGGGRYYGETFTSNMDASANTSGKEHGGESADNGHGGGGAGFYSDGQDGDSYDTDGRGGSAFINGGAGADANSDMSYCYSSSQTADGGFGGGGSCGNTHGSGGGGGGYSGGGAGENGEGGGENELVNAGGGGSFVISGAENVATSSGFFQDTSSNDDGYTGSVAEIGQYNNGHGEINFKLISEVRNPTPEDESYDIKLSNASTNISVEMVDGINDPRNVTFYNSTDGVIGEVENVSANERAEVRWTGLENGTSYEWYVETEDNGTITESPTYTFETLYYRDNFLTNKSRAVSDPEGGNSSVVNRDLQNLSLSVFVYRNNDSYPENVWAELDHQGGSTYKYSLENSTSLNNSQEFFRDINASKEGLPPGNYEASFYANGTDDQDNLIEQNEILNESFHITEGICDRGGYDTECEVRSQDELNDGESISGTGRLEIQDGSLLKNGNGYTESAELNFSEIEMFDGSGIYGNVNLTAENITLSSGSYINTTGLGYTSGMGPGAPGDDNYEEGGGGFGGYGGDGQNSDGGSFYSLAENPLATAEGYGSGGANDGSDDESGGGRIILNGSEIVINGELKSDGTKGSDPDSSGGAGGSIVVDGSNVTGTGSLSAQGERGEYDTGGGAGGRIAFINDSWESTSLVLNVQGGAEDGGDGEAGETGTIYPQNVCDSGDLSSVCYVSSEYNVFEPIEGTGDLVVENGGRLISNDDISIDMNNVTVDSGGEIDAEYGSLNVNSSVLDNSGNIYSSNSATWNTDQIDISGSANTNDLELNTSGISVSGTLSSTNLDVSVLTNEDQLNVSGTVSASSNLNITGLLDNSYNYSSSGKLVGGQINYNQNSLDSLTVSNGIFGINGSRNVFTVNTDSLTVKSGATLRGNLDSNVSDFVVESGGEVDAEGLGYQAGNGPGHNGRYCGAGFGGRGGGSNADSCVGGDPYSNITDPLLEGNGFGSGGRDYGYAHGGGKIIVEASDFQSNGTLTSDAESFTDYGHSGGSGGTVIIDSPSISGDGKILARGANATGGSNYGGGGGGRVVFEDQSWSAGNISIDVSGGQPSGNNAEPGITGTYYPFNTICDTGGLDSTCTVERFYQDVNESVEGSGDLIIERGAGLESNNELNISMNSVTTKSDAVLRAANGPLNINTTQDINMSGEAYSTSGSEWGAENMTIDGYVEVNEIREDLILRASNEIDLESNTDIASNLDLKASQLDMVSSASIDATELGYESFSGPGAPSDNSYEEGGGGFGGIGGDGQYSQGGSSYGTPKNPFTAGGYGSGGTNDGNTVRSGGGKVVINTTSASINGDISADGTLGPDNGASGGSGGLIYVESDSVSGSGSLSAEGGQGEDDTGSGGGGRITFADASWETTSLSISLKSPETGFDSYDYSDMGVTGSLYPQNVCDSGDLSTTCYVDSDHQGWEEINGTGNLVVRNDGLLESNDDLNISMNNVTVRSGGMLRTKEGSVNIQEADVLVEGDVESMEEMNWSTTSTVSVPGEVTVGKGDTFESSSNGQGFNLSEASEFNVSGTVDVNGWLDASNASNSDISGNVQTNSDVDISSKPGQGQGLQVSGTLNSGGLIDGNAVNDVTVSGTLDSNNLMNLSSTDSFQVSGTVNSGGDMDVSSTNAVEIESGADVTPGGDFMASGTNKFNVNGTLTATNDIRLDTTNNVDIRGDVTSNSGSFNATQTQNFNIYSGATLDTQNYIDVSSTDNVNVNGTVTSGDDFLSTQAGNIEVVGTLDSAGLFESPQATEIDVSGTLEANNNVNTGSVTDAQISGDLTSVNNNVDFSSVENLDVTGLLEAGNTIQLDSLPELVINGGTIRTNGNQEVLDLRGLTEVDLNSGTSLESNVNISATNFSVSDTSTVDATGLGHNQGPGYVSSSCGSSYGGQGGNPSGCSGPASVYSSAIDPLEEENGFGSGNQNGDGGGIIVVRSDRFEMEGTLTSNGENVGTGGGPSGGSIVVDVQDQISGNGVFNVNGGDAGTGGGGGGRIAFVGAKTWEGGNFDFNALGGSGSDSGVSGTVYPVIFEAEWESQSTNEDGFRVYSNQTGSWKRLGEFPVSAAPGDVISRNVRGPSGDYVCFRVVSYNMFGESNVTDGNEVCDDSWN